MTCKRILTVAVVCAIALGSVGSAKAVIVFHEDWSTATTTNFVDLGVDNYSQLGPGKYYIPSTLPGWTLSGQVGGWSTDPSSTISGVLLNEGSYGSSEGAITLTALVNGLQVGSQYSLSFDYWGDNRPDSTYGFDYAIGGGGNHVNGTWMKPDDTGTFNTINYVFTALQSSVALSFTADTVPPSQASVIIGQVTVSSVPEPSTIVLLGIAAIGLFAWRRRRRQAA